MSFKVLVDPQDGGPLKVIHEVTDRRVTRVGFTGSSGEVGAMLVTPDRTEVLITFEYAQQDGRPTLQDVEAEQTPLRTGEEADAAIAKQASLPSATNTGVDFMLSNSQSDSSSVAAAPQSESSPAVPEAGDSEGAGTVEPQPTGFNL